MPLPIFYNCLSNTKNAPMRWLVRPNWETKSMFRTKQLTVLKSTLIHHFINYFLFAILIWPIWSNDDRVVLYYISLSISVIRKQIHNRWSYWFIVTLNVLCLNYWKEKQLIDIDPPPSSKDKILTWSISRSNPLFTDLQEKDYYEVVSLSSGYFSTYKRGGELI